MALPAYAPDHTSLPAERSFCGRYATLGTARRRVGWRIERRYDARYAGPPVCETDAERMRFRIRRANIPAAMRDEFERYGADVVAQAFAVGILPDRPLPGLKPMVPLSHAVETVLNNQPEAAAWLTEKRDEAEYHQSRLEIVQWSILIFVTLSVIFDFLILWHGK